MSTLRNRALAAAAIAALGFVFAAPAEALTIAAMPSATQVAIGDVEQLSLNISGLGSTLLGGFDIKLSYDPKLLSFDPASAGAVSFGPGLGDVGAFEAIPSVSLRAPGLIEVAEVSLLDSSGLAALQGGGSFDLADLFFAASGDGQPVFALSSVQLVDAAGLPVPEPASWLLLAGLPLGAALRWRTVRLG